MVGEEVAARQRVAAGQCHQTACRHRSQPAAPAPAPVLASRGRHGDQARALGADRRRDRPGLPPHLLRPRPGRFLRRPARQPGREGRAVGVLHGVVVEHHQPAQGLLDQRVLVILIHLVHAAGEPPYRL